MLHFHKYQGTGNDFILLDNREGRIALDTARIAFLCDRRFGIGADGLMLLENADGYDFRMVYYNSDGRESTMCGNGGRCISVFARAIGVPETSGRFIAIDGPHDYVILEPGDRSRIRMIDVPTVEREGENLILFTGSPHYVCFRDDTAELDIVSEARKIRYNERFSAEGINVNFVDDRNSRVSMRTYERGVEGETLSCGTGTVAAALALEIRLPSGADRREIQTPGGQLTVFFRRSGDSFTDIWLEGPAVKVFEGDIEN